MMVPTHWHRSPPLRSNSICGVSVGVRVGGGIAGVGVGVKRQGSGVDVGLGRSRTASWWIGIESVGWWRGGGDGVTRRVTTM